ncbi:hypothetical protein [Pseudonocardia sp. KRD291]|uniref:hypothetical protein n=1 Tax=Pseudonocardia sp. KRD291 TaxID=2792007 RepID=UPI001C49EEE5|nr:hypothetical protein [Pseudonocardia sp. KRD291]MBW0104822.1 hypothetical protein [Pseudonocardia sp. KRD291]
MTLARSPHLASQFPDGVASRAQLRALGIADSTISRRCRPGGPWQSPVPGQIVLGSGALTRRQKCRVGLGFAGPGAILTGAVALSLHGARRNTGDGSLQVLIPARRAVHSRSFVVVTRTGRMPEPGRRHGLPVAPVARCLADLAARSKDRDEMRAVFADAIQHGICQVEDLAAELDEIHRPSTALARAVLSEVTDGVRSTAEAWARDLVARSGLPVPEWNVELVGPDGRSLGVVDAYWREVGLAWEIQSETFHLSPEALDRDVTKLAGLAACGVAVVPTMAGRLRSEPRTVVEALGNAYAAAAASPTPLVQARLHRRAARQS